jgi:hypothetical protein
MEDFAVQIHVHEAPKSSIVEEPLADTGVVGVEVGDDVLQRCTFDKNHASPTGMGAQNHWDTDIDGHLEPSLQSRSRR